MTKIKVKFYHVYTNVLSYQPTHLSLVTCLKNYFCTNTACDVLLKTLQKIIILCHYIYSAVSIKPKEVPENRSKFLMTTSCKK